MTTNLARQARRNQLYQFCCAYYEANKRAPAYRDIQRALGYRSMCSVQHHLRKLEAEGLVTLRPGQARSMIIHAYDHPPDEVLVGLSRQVVASWESGGLGPAIRALAAHLDALDAKSDAG